MKELNQKKKSCVSKNRQSKKCDVRTYLRWSHLSRSTASAVAEQGPLCGCLVWIWRRRDRVLFAVRYGSLHGQRAHYSLPWNFSYMLKGTAILTLILGLSSPFTEKETESHWDHVACPKAFRPSELDVRLQSQNSVPNPLFSFLFLPQIMSDSRG